MDLVQNHVFFHNFHVNKDDRLYRLISITLPNLQNVRIYNNLYVANSWKYDTPSKTTDHDISL